MQYDKIFDPDSRVVDLRNEAQQAAVGTSADRRDGRLYCYNDNIILRVNVALATGRPLLVRGPSGCGKSSLAYNVARVMGRRYYEKVITARDQARDLLWRFDAVRRLGDAQAWSARQAQQPPVAADGGSAAQVQQLSREFESYYPYIEPEVLWWVFDRPSATRRGLPPQRERFFAEAVDPVIYSPERDDRTSDADAVDRPCVVLIDEIDKADPDVPNDLLVPLGSFEFRVDESGRRIYFGGDDRRKTSSPELSRLPLVVITSNDERRLPPAFLRRCVQLEIEAPTPERLLEIAVATNGEQHRSTYQRVLQAVSQFNGSSSTAADGTKRIDCSIAEFLDAVQACLQLDRRKDANVLDAILQATTWKRPTSRESEL